MHWGRVTSFIILVGTFLFCQSLAHAQTSCEITPEDSCKFSDIYFYDTHYDAKGFSVLFSNFYSEHPFGNFKVKFSNEDGAVYSGNYSVDANPTDQSYEQPLTYVNRIEFEVFDFFNPLPGGATQLTFTASGSIIGFLEQTDSPELPAEKDVVEETSEPIVEVVIPPEPQKMPEQLIQEDQLSTVKETAQKIRDDSQTLLTNWPDQKAGLSTAIDDVIELDANIQDLIEQLEATLPNAEASTLIDQLSALRAKRAIGPDFKTNSQEAIRVVDKGLSDLESGLGAVYLELQNLTETFESILTEPELIVVTDNLTENTNEILQFGATRIALEQGVQGLTSGTLDSRNLVTDEAELASLKQRANELHGSEINWMIVALLAGLFFLATSYLFRSNGERETAMPPEDMKSDRDRKIEELREKKTKRNPRQKPKVKLSENRKPKRAPIDSISEDILWTEIAAALSVSGKKSEKGLLFVASSAQAQGIYSYGSFDASTSEVLVGGELEEAISKPIGRIGQRWRGLPPEREYSLGTGFLITDQHVMTNWHVYDKYGKYLTDSQDHKTHMGIEFLAYEALASYDDEWSEHYKFDGKPPIVLEGLDIAIFKLEKKVTDRDPIVFKRISSDSLLERNIRVIGHPFPRGDDMDSPVFGDNPTFAVKRSSEGQIFVPKALNQKAIHPYEKDPHGDIPVFCHNASTSGGSSGSPVFDNQTHELLGVHFYGESNFERSSEAANLAMPVNAIIDKLPEEIIAKLNGVT